MRASILAFAILILCASTGSAFAAFAGAYAPEHWTFYSDGGNCSGSGELYEDLMIVEGVDCETGHCTLCLAHYLLTAPEDATLSFHYLFTSTDSGAWDYVDRAFYMLNGEITFLAWIPASGDDSLVVAEGDEFALGVWSEDGLGGSAEVRVTNFEVTAPPEPGSLVLLAAGALAVLRRRR